MSVWYLDLDDEMTDAVARLRGAPDDHVVLVIPPGSRIGTGRINFRLLAREASTRNLSVALVSGDAQVRSLAAAAGLTAFGSVMEAERTVEAGPAAAGASPEPANAEVPSVAALATSSTAPGPTAGAAMVAGASAGAVVSRGPGIGARFRVRGRSAPVPLPSYAMTPRGASVAAETGWTDTGGLAADAPRTAASGASRHKVRGRVVRLTLLAGVVGGVAMGAYVALPTASITLQPLKQTMGPSRVPIKAVPGAQADAETGVVPAERVPLDLSATDTFKATGRDLQVEPATGTVVFSGQGTQFAVSVPEGTVVSTPGGVNFVTLRTIILAKVPSLSSPPSKASTPVRAQKLGPDGNVPAGAISIVPSALERNQVSVNNPLPTTGGSKDRMKVVSDDDYDSALADLTKRLDAQLAAELADPANTPPGATLYPASASLGAPVARPARADLVGTPGANFDLTLATTASVLAVDQGVITQTAGETLQKRVPVGTRFFPESVTADIGSGILAGDSILFDVAVQAQIYRQPNANDILDDIRGKPVSEAKGILGSYGNATVSVWPDFLPNLPDDVRRISLTIKSPEVPTQ